MYDVLRMGDCQPIGDLIENGKDLILREDRYLGGHLPLPSLELFFKIVSLEKLHRDPWKPQSRLLPRRENADDMPALQFFREWSFLREALLHVRIVAEPLM